MRQFIKLTSMIINTNYINKINIEKNKYIIHLLNNQPNKLIKLKNELTLPKNDIIKVFSKKNPVDYKIVTDWIG